MNTREAIQAMLDGKKVTPKEWVDTYVFFNGTHFVREDGKQFLFGSLEYEWEIYEEPKPKQTVTIEKWLCASGFNMAYYTEEATKEYFDRYSKDRVKLLDTYEVEL